RRQRVLAVVSGCQGQLWRRPVVHGLHDAAGARRRAVRLLQLAAITAAAKRSADEPGEREGACAHAQPASPAGEAAGEGTGAGSSFVPPPPPPPPGSGSTEPDLGRMT